MWSLIFVTNLTALAISLAVLVLRRPLGVSKTFSQHAAQSNALSAYYFVIFAVTLPLFCLFIYSWLIPAYELSRATLYLFAVATVTQIACTLYPDRNSSRQVFTHRLLAGISAAFFFVTLLVLCLELTGAMRAVCIAGVGVMALVAIATISSKGKMALLLQAAYYLGFFAPLLILTFV